jgi:hypothetical protein
LVSIVHHSAYSAPHRCHLGADAESGDGAGDQKKSGGPKPAAEVP